MRDSYVNEVGHEAGKNLNISLAKRQEVNV